MPAFARFPYAMTHRSPMADSLAERHSCRMTNPKLLRGRTSDIGACYAITTVCRARQPVFAQAELANKVVAGIQECVRGGAVESIAWVVMPDHMHWLLQLRDPSLSRCLQAFKSRTAHAINFARGCCGPVWQAGFYDHRLRCDEDLRAQAMYVIANPLRQGLVERIEDYPFWWCRWIKRHDDE